MFERLKNILVEELSLNADDVTMESELANDLGVNSLELADLVLVCEDEFGVEFNEDDIHKFITVGDVVDVTGTTKGRGFTGTIQRWNHARGPMTHGSGYHRGVGSMGSSADPSHVFKNKKMAGQYGNERVTIQNLEIAKVDVERNLLLIKGAIPGANGNLVFVKSAVKK